MTDCPNGDIRDLLPDLLHGRLGAAERAEVEAHLRDCDLCREELELLRGMRAALRRAPAVDVGGIVASIPPYRAPARQMPGRSWGGWRIAAAITLLAGGTSVVVARHGADMRADSAQVAVVTAGGSAARAVQPTHAASATSSGAAATTTEQAPRELALAGGTIGDLDDSELSTLIDDIGTLSAVTPADVDNGAPVGPIPPTSPSGTYN